MKPMLSFENVNVAIADAPVLRNVSFSLLPGVSAALIGRNGAGKTTTVRTIIGFTKASGTVCFPASPWKKISCFPAVSPS